MFYTLGKVDILWIYSYIMFAKQRYSFINYTHTKTMFKLGSNGCEVVKKQ